MKTRLISGACYVALLVGIYLLKIFVHDLFFDALVYFFAVVGTVEILRATKDKTTRAQRAIALLFAITAIPACAILENFLRLGWTATCACFLIFATALLLLLVLDYQKTTLESLGVALLSGIYPTLLLCVLVLVNHFDAGDASALSAVAFNSDLFVLLIFVISPLADTFAYLFGMSLGKKFPKKMSPSISPNKTVVGGIGGLVGGVVSAVAVYFIYGATAGSYADMQIWLPIYALLGLLGAVATAFGDLVESAVKRKIGVKDMGKIMPGHGGVLDRIDGTLFASIVVYIAVLLVRAIV